MFNINKLNNKSKLDRIRKFVRKFNYKNQSQTTPISYLFNVYLDLNNVIKRPPIPKIALIKSDDPVVQQMIKDVIEHMHEDKQNEMWIQIEEVIKKERLEIEENEKQAHILKAMATYATSYSHYGPVVAEWVESLLETAFLEKRKLIFLARDGIAPYHAACMLKAANSPKFDSVELSLIYVSRTLAYSSILLDDKISSSDEHVKSYVTSLKNRDPNILRKYIVQECHLKANDRCLFVDVGFTGSIITPIVSQLEDLGISSRFSFLISHTSKRKVKSDRHDAKGFLAHHEKRPLEVVNKAGGNPAVHWIEDTHQSVVNSAKVLAVNEAGRIVPGTVVKSNGEFCVKPLFGSDLQICVDQPDVFLVKTFGLRGVLDAVLELPKNRSDEPMEAWKEASEYRREVFGKFLSSFHSSKRALLIKH